MEFKPEIDNLREEFAIHRQHNDRILKLIDALHAENLKLRSIVNMQARDIDDEQ
jgi:hypothetical protein|tara:strand:- start:201 stop:362 length:162 start_codon:yes stop_codon:yes gene_type:complete